MHILLAVKDVSQWGTLATRLRGCGYEVVKAADTAELLIRLRSCPFAAVVMDLALPGIHPLELLPGLRTAWPDTPVILLGPRGNEPYGAVALERGAYAVLPEPVQPDDLLRDLADIALAHDAVPVAVASVGTVVEEVQAGWRLADDIARPASIVVGLEAHPAPDPQSADADRGAPTGVPVRVHEGGAI